uniref:Uncharacterized protein n=1 Tax=Anopheles albimanus TaxID=7167 RepID=A0A182FAE2_ANOAL
MNVIRFKLPANFEPKCKAYRGHRRVRHQVEHPDDYNVQQRAARTSVNYANHWDLLTEALRHEARWPRIRIGESARNRITRLHHADYPAQQCWQNRPYDMLTSAFIVRTAARIASLEQQRSLVRNRARTDRTMTGASTATNTTVVTTPGTGTAASSRRLSRATSVDVPDVREDEEDEEEQSQDEVERRYYYPYHPPPLMVIGKRATGGSHELRTKPIPPSVRLNQRKKPSR